MRLTRSVRREEKSSLGEIGGEGANNEYSEMRKQTTLSANVIVLTGRFERGYALLPIP